MITLYHGSSAKVEAPLVHLGRTDLDFGQGFYLTQLKEQAEAWAVIICSRKKNNPTPWLNIYQFDMDKAILQGYKILNQCCRELFEWSGRCGVYIKAIGFP